MHNVIPSLLAGQAASTGQHRNTGVAVPHLQPGAELAAKRLKELLRARRQAILLFGKNYPIFLTRSDREEMRYPVLLGRKFLTKRFVVDINNTDLSYKLKLKNEY
jgi:hypothetical protein